MPMLIPLALSLGAAAAGVGTTLGTVLSIASVVSSVVIGSIEQRKAKAKARDEANAAQVDRLANVVTTVASRELVLGRVRKGGAIYFRGSAGEYQDTLIAHIAIAGHEIDAVERIYLNDEPVTLDDDGWVRTAPYYQPRKDSRSALIAPGQTTVELDRVPVQGSVSVYTRDEQTGNPETGFSGTPAAAVPFTLSGTTVTISQPYIGWIDVGYQVIVETSYARVRWELGSPNAVADARTRDVFPGLWTENHRAQGVAKLIVEFLYNETAFPNGAANVTAVVRGAQVYDPRTGNTAWSDNPALLARHVYTHPQFGKGSLSSAEDARISAAANACDTTHPFVVSGGTDTQAIYRSSLVVPFGTPARSALDDLCAAMAGAWAVASGELYIRAGVYTAPVMTLTDADLAVIQRNGDSEEQEAINISPHRERADKFNTVNPRIWDAGQDYKEVALTPVKSAALITRDGQELAQDVQLTAVFFSPQAQHVCGVMMRDARDPLTVEAPFKLSAYPLEIFDTIALTLARYGWTAKTFMVLGRLWDREKGVVRLTLKETSAAIFTPDAEFLPQGYAKNTALPAPWDIHPPLITASGIYSGTDELVRQGDGSLLTRVRVAWPAVTDASVQQGGQIELQWMPATGTTWQTILLAGSDTQAYILGAADGSAIRVRARSRTTLATSDWSLQAVHVVQGKLQPPNPPQNVALTRDAVIFVPSPDIDVIGYRILYNTGSNANRSVATQLHTGLVTSSPWPLPVSLYGTNTIIVVAVDVVGKESAAATDTQNLGLPDAANIADTEDIAAAGYPGVITNGTVAGTTLSSNLDPAADFYGAASGGDIYYRDGAADIYGGDQYLQLQYQWNYAAPYSGGAILMDLEMSGARSMIEYRIDGGADGDIYDDGARPDFYADDVAGIYGASPAYGQWSGSIAPTDSNITYEFRITVEAGSAQGEITVLEMRTEMPAIEQVFSNVAVSSGGTTIAPAAGVPVLDFIAIEDVQITPIAGSAVAGRVKTFPIDPATGAVIELLNASGTAVSGNAYVRQRGY